MPDTSIFSTGTLQTLLRDLPALPTKNVAATSYDKDFLEGVKGGFNSVGISGELFAYIIIVFALVGAVFLLAKMLEPLYSKMRLKGLPAYWVVRKKDILNILQYAVAERSKFEMKFLPSEYARPVAVCTLLEIKPSGLTFEVGSGASVTKRWLDRSAEFYFRIKGDNKQHIYYRLTSTVVGVKKLPNDLNTIITEFPDKLELQQKRSFLRLEPPAQYLLGLAVWHDKGSPKPAEVNRWGRPHLLHQPDRAANPVMVEDVSAGGMRLLITRSALKNSNLSLSIADRLYIVLDLYDPEVSRKRRFWLQSRVQHVYEDFETRNAEYGLQFIAWGRPRKEEEDGVVSVDWREIEQDGIELLGSWIMKRHLELYRDKGIV